MAAIRKRGVISICNHTKIALRLSSSSNACYLELQLTTQLISMVLTRFDIQYSIIGSDSKLDSTTREAA